MPWGSLFMRNPSINDIKFLVIRRKADTVRFLEFIYHDSCRAGIRVETINAGRQLKFGYVPFIVEHNTVSGIGKPDMPIRMDCYIVRCVERFSVKVVHQHSNRSVIFGSSDAPRTVFATDESPLSIAGVSVAIIGRFTVDAYFTGGFLPFQNPIVRNIAPEQIPAIAEPDGSFCPSRS